MDFIEDDLEQFNSEVDPGITDGLDPDTFDVFVKNPSDIPEEVMFQLADLIDGKYNLTPDEINEAAPTPDTVDRLMNAVTIVYITEDRIPVAVASIIDPTQKSYMGFVPLDLYSLHSAQNLDGRVQLEFVAVNDESRGTPVEQELASQMNALGTPMFAAITASNRKTAGILGEFGFKPVSSMDIDSNGEPVILWLDRLDEETSDDTAEDEVVS